MNAVLIDDVSNNAECTDKHTHSPFKKGLNQIGRAEVMILGEKVFTL